MKLIARLASFTGTVLGTLAALLSFPFVYFFGPSLDELIGSKHQKDTPLDRFKWALGSADVIEPGEAIRPIHAVLDWLAERGLLTEEGKLVFDQVKHQGETDVALLPEQMSAEAFEFLSHCYEEWYSTTGINYAIDLELPIVHDQRQDEMWHALHATN